MVSSGADLKQKGPPCDRKGERANVAPLTQEAPLMRLSVASLRRMVKRPLHVEFVPQQFTSYSGLELLRRYLRQCELPSRLRAACASTGGDYGGGRLALLILALFYVGARRLEQLRYVASDPLIARFCGLARLPTARGALRFLHRGTCMAEHPELVGRHQLRILPEHGPGAIARTARHRRSTAPTRGPLGGEPVVEVRDLALYDALLEDTEIAAPLVRVDPRGS